jgi:hypothetical protein
MADLHVTPVNDLVEHDTSPDGDCLCGPTDQPLKRGDGSVAWIAVHHSLDGRARPQADTTLTALIGPPDGDDEE